MTSFQETNDRERNMAVMPSGRGNDATIDADAFDAAIGSIGTGRSYRRKAVVYFENDRAECIYRVLSGSVFTYRVLADGRRQIVGLYLLGDFFGFEHSEEHSLSAEVVRDAKILVIKKKRLAALPNRHAAIERQLSVLLVREVGCMQDRILLLAKNAQERVVEFLYDMEKRTSANDCVELPLLRQDIADYLGLTIETVSRTLSFLESCAAIKRVRGRRILLYSHSLPTNDASVGHPQRHRQSGRRIQQSGHEFRQLDQQGFP